MFAEVGDICHLCGHAGATDADHLVPLAIAIPERITPDMLAPAHGVRGCPTCGRRCNQERGARMDYAPPVNSRNW
jgi:hypothetical protein